MDKQTAIIRRNSFEPRFGVAQMVFGIIYAFIAGIGLVLAVYTFTASGHEHPWTQYFFVLLFCVLAGKSFFMYAKTRILYTGGKHTVARVTSVTAEKGLTIVQGAVRASDDGPEFEFESRYAGMNVARELERFMDEQHSRFLPALIVGQNDHPRAMFLIKTRAGHLDNDYINSLKTDRK